jgi:hypothetical protein
MSHDRLSRTTTDMYPPAQAVGKDAQVQLKQSLAGLPYNEQVQRLRPPLPMGTPAIQMKADGTAVQFNGGGKDAPAKSVAGSAGGAVGAGVGSGASLSGATVSVSAAGEVTISGAKVSVAAGQIDLKTPQVTASGVVQAGTIIADRVVGSSYTPGAGNIF